MASLHESADFIGPSAFQHALQRDVFRYCNFDGLDIDGPGFEGISSDAHQRLSSIQSLGQISIMKTTVYEDHWQGTSSKDIEYTTGDPALVEASISRLDGKSRTSVSMSRGEDMLCIGGGNDGRYMAYFAHNVDEALFNLIDPSAPEGGPELTIVTGGQAGACRPSSCLSLSIVTIAAVHFVETGEMSPELQWIEG